MDSSFASRTRIRERSVPVVEACCNAGYHRNKAVAIGAVSYYIDHFVAARVLKFTYGVPCETTYDPSDPEHARRFNKSYVDEIGTRYVRGAFDTMLTRVRRAHS